MKIIISNNFKDDITEIFHYISKDSSKYASKTLNNIYFFIEKLKYYPHIGRYVPELCDKSFRELIYKNYRIVYQVQKSLNTVYIHFVVHGKRNFKLYYNSYIKNNF